MKGSETQGPEKSAKETERHHRLSEQAQQLILDNRFIEAVEKARVDKEERTRMTKDPEAYRRERGVEIPEEIHVEMTEGDSFLLCTYYYYFQYRVQYCYWFSGF